MNGILLIDKPEGWTSSDVVAKLRGVLHERRIGHSGTLDPMATGLLVLFVGRATRAAEYAEGHDKRYIAGLRLGTVTDTQDTTGTVIGGTPCTVSRAELETALNAFRGELMQLPPMYSAIKIKGQKLYEIARRGGEVERKPRPVTIYSLALCGAAGEDYLLDIRCSKGTYVRTLCHDLGQTLGCGACMSSLRRLEAGSFRLEQAHTLDEVISAADEGRAHTMLLPTDSLFSACPALILNEQQEKKLRCGAELDAGGEAEGLVRLYGSGGEFLALGQIRGPMLRVKKSFYEV